MIQINKTHKSAQEIHELAIEYKNEYLKINKKRINDFLSEKSNSQNNSSDFRSFCLEYLKDWEEILVLLPSELEKMKIKYKKYEFLFNENNKQKKEATEIIEFLGYSDLRKSEYFINIISKLGIETCPFCNAQPIFIYRKVDKKFRLLAQLDHYYPKTKYPFLSVAFYNLIPSCSYCNQKKGKKDLPEDFYHPYKNEVIDGFNFEIDIDSLLNGDIYKNKSLKIKVKNKTEIDSVDYKKIKQFLETIDLNSMYSTQEMLASEIFMKKELYPESRKKELLELFKDNGNIYNLTPGELDLLILGNKVEKSEILKRPLSKFMQDIAKDVGLID